MYVSLITVAKTVVINEKHEVLILTIGNYPEHPEKSFTPDLPGGLVDPGETELVAARREMQEEAGITLPEEVFTLLYALTRYIDSKHESVTQFLYVVRLDITPEVTVSWEHATYEWVPLEKLKSDVVLRPFYREAVNYGFEVGLL